MRPHEIYQANKMIAEQKAKTEERPIYYCGFVGTLMEWKNFLEENKENLQWRGREEAMFKNGTQWQWFPEDEMFIYTHRCCRCQFMIIPRRIHYDLFWGHLYPAVMTYCVGIQWYGEHDYHYHLTRRIKNKNENEVSE